MIRKLIWKLKYQRKKGVIGLRVRAKEEGKRQGRVLGNSTLTWTLPYIPRQPPWVVVWIVKG